MTSPHPFAGSPSADDETRDAWLALAQCDGRLGFWRADPATGQAEGDATAWRCWGLDASAGAVPLERLREQLRPAERPAFDAALAGNGGDAAILHCRLAALTARPRQLVLRLRAVHAAGRRLVAGTVSAVDGDAGADATTFASDLGLAVDLARIALWRHDLLANRIYYNEQAFRVLDLVPRPEGLPLEEVRALVHPEDLPRVTESADAALASDEPTDMAARYRRADGSWRDVMTRRVVQRDADGRPVAFLGVAIDVTEQQDAARALSSARERAALVAHAVGIGTWEHDPASGLATWDAQMWLLRGLEPRPGPIDADERMASVHPDDRERVRDRIAGTAIGVVPFEYEYRVVLPDGRVRWLASRSIALQGAPGAPARRLGVNWDITDQRTAEATRRERELALSESRAKSEFLARMSHELRTPLNAVLGFAQLLMTEEPGADPASAQRRRRLEHIRTAGRHLLSLINDVLDLARVEGGEMSVLQQPVALAPLVAEALPLVQPQAMARGVQLRVEDLPYTVRGDPTRLRQVLLNLLSNAIKYNREGGAVTVSAGAEGHPGTDEARIVIAVSDTGRGMDADQMGRLFQPFSRLHADTEQVEGTGIGLAIVKALVERMGGSVCARSRPGHGSTFELRLPAEPQAVPAALRPVAEAEPAAAAAEAGATRHRVLYIEDNPINALIIGELLGQRGDVDLEVAVDGTSGVTRAREWRPALVLLDMQLPDIDGLEVLRRLRAAPETTDMTVVALSANAMPADIQRALAAGMSDYWTKPLDFKAFLAHIEVLLGKPPTPAAPAAGDRS